ncbi:transmembrane protein 182-like isoform X2 [Mastacembelus armatus]|uniref:transmembrane protein 182-like isoform X2 n=1 Tax=Mastacembelus armatus TaxID=205130 RepID=UPI000E45C657|nr:transmembrane protein 182-like isoform X2 [Mastacembelus armatus]
MSPAERLRVLLFLALFFGAVGFLFTLLSCGTEYWLLAAESCSRSGGRGAAVKDVRIFHEGLFWRCSFTATSHENSMWDLWISKQPLSKVCQAAFLFPFPLNKPLQPWVEPHSLPTEPYEHQSAIVFRTFWSIFLVAGVAAVVIGGFISICAGPLTNHKLYKVLDTLEQFALHQRVSSCPSFHLSIQHGPSFLLAPVAVFFSLLAGLLFILLGQGICGTQLDKIHKIPELSTPDDYL